MFDILSHNGNANQNYTEIQSHPNQNDDHQENKQQQMLVRMYMGVVNTYTLLVEI
jgi:hypothetical protein